MFLMMGQELPEAAGGQRSRDAGQVQDLGHHQEHDESTIGIHRDQSLRKRWFHHGGDARRGCNGLRSHGMSSPKFFRSVLSCCAELRAVWGYSLMTAISAQ